MAHFYGDVSGSRGPASRLGGKNSGIRTTASGWTVGARVQIHHDEESGKDVVRVYRTKGSDPASSSVLIAEYTDETPRGKEFVK